MKTSDLTGAQLDFWVARAEDMPIAGIVGGQLFIHGPHSPWTYRPSISWEQGGPIIERERIRIWPQHDEAWAARTRLVAVQSEKDAPYWGGHGPTPLIAAMRAHVASKFGEEVDVA